MHPFVEAMEMLIARSRLSLREAVNSGRVTPKLARAEYDKLQAMKEFMEACQLRYDAERAYTYNGSYPPDNSPILQHIAQGDGNMRLLWEKWTDGEQKDADAAAADDDHA